MRARWRIRGQSGLDDNPEKYAQMEDDQTFRSSFEQ
jgi:hypothetical protein